MGNADKWHQTFSKNAVELEMGNPKEEVPWWLSGKNLPANAGDTGSIPWLGRAPGVGTGNPLQYSCLEKSMDREACQATVHRVAKSRT